MSIECFINGPAGRIQMRYHENPNPDAPTVLVLHPHPQGGGTMNNKVTYTMFRTFVEKGFHVLRFNFRGVGRSEGTYSEGKGELMDAAACFDWLLSRHPESSDRWIAGFSFGAWISMQLLMRRPEIKRFVCVAPPANLFDFSFLAPCPVSGYVAYGDKDRFAFTEYVEKLVSRLRLQKGIEVESDVIKGADHLFTHHIEELNQHIGAYIDRIRASQPYLPPEVFHATETERRLASA